MQKTFLFFEDGRPNIFLHALQFVTVTMMEARPKMQNVGIFCPSRTTLKNFRRNINWSNLTNVQSANPESVMKDQRPVKGRSAIH